MAISVIDEVGHAIIIATRIQRFDASFALKLACLTSSKDLLTLANISH
jgi:hypothetical protein